MSYYIPMRDGVGIALSLWFPGGAPTEQEAPTVLVQTRYGRARVFGDPESPWTYQRLLDAGYTVAIIDTRGSTASFGPREVDIGPDEVQDMDEVVAHLASRPWSNGQVFAMGVSYMADTADIATSRPAPALKGAVIREADFDVWGHLFFPGGVKNEWFLQAWGAATRRMDLGQSVDPSQGLDCALRADDCAALFPLLQAVDGDDDFCQLRRALMGRNRWQPDTYLSTEFRDDIAANGYALFASSPAAHLAGVRKEKLPVQYWGSWLDGGTAEAALARYRSAPEAPMEVWITANNHPGTVLADPFFPGDKLPRPSLVEQRQRQLDFLDRVSGGEAVVRRVHYYVLGSGGFKESAEWPPADSREYRLALTADGRLATPPSEERQERVYEVDFSATSGQATRWSTQFDTDPAYPDRRDEDRKLLTYDSDAFDVDMELVGTPVLRIDIATLTEDPAIHAYLEDVGPGGRVTYLTEGIFRLINRRPADTESLPYDQGPAPHSYLREDAEPMIPGQFARVEFAFFPIAARIAAGHWIRLAIAGTDADTFLRYSNGQAETFRIGSGGPDPSNLSVGMRPWRD